MQSYKSITFCLFVILLSSLCFAVTSQVTSFFSQSNPFNITFTGNENQTYWLPIPKYGYVQNVSLSLYGKILNSSINLNTNLITANFIPNFYDSLVSYYTFDDNKTNLTSFIYYDTNNNYNFYGNDTPLLANGIINSSAYNLPIQYFNSTINLSNIMNNNITINLWVNKTGMGSRVSVLSQEGDTCDDILFFGFDSLQPIFMSKKDGVLSYVECNTALPDLNWHMVTYKYISNSSNSRIYTYIDGTECISTDTYITYGSFKVTGNTYLFALKNLSCFSGNNYGGKYDELTIFNKSISQDYINYLYSNGVPKYIQDSINYTYKNFSVNTTLINSILSSGCTCSNCSIDGNNCKVPFTFHSDGVLGVNLTNATSAYEINNCSGSVIPSNATALNITFLDSNSLPINILYGSTTNYYSNNYSLYSPSLNRTSLCVYPNWANISASTQFQYTDGGSIIYNYFLSTYLNNLTQLLNLYTQNSTTQVLFTVQDLDENPLVNYTIQILKYNVGTGTYTLTESLKTDSNGHSIGNIVLNTAYYNFLVYDSNLALVKTQTGVLLTTNTYTFTITGAQEAFYTDASNAIGVTYNLYFNNATENVVFIWGDPAGAMHLACLKVENSTYLGKETMSDTCTQAISGTIVYNVQRKNDTTYFATGYLKYDYVFPLKTIQFWLEQQRDFFSQDRFNSLFMAMILILVGILIGLPNINFSMIYFVGAVVVTSILGMWYLTMPLAGSLCILGLIILLIGGKQQ